MTALNIETTYNVLKINIFILDRKFLCSYIYNYTYSYNKFIFTSKISTKIKKNIISYFNISFVNNIF